MLIAGRIAYLTDFGLTKRIAGTTAPLTQAGDVVGTIHYTAPEQIEGREVTARSDVYSLGCVLYHCLTGRMPYERETDVAVIYAHLSEDPPKPSVVRPELPSGLDGVIAKALDKSPDRRFESARGPDDRGARRGRRGRAAAGDDRPADAAVARCDVRRGDRGDARGGRRGAALACAAGGRGRLDARDRQGGSGGAGGRAGDAGGRAGRRP